MLSRLRRSMADQDQGFTLIELLVVIIIIGILAAIAIPVFLNQRKKAVDASMKSDLKNAATLVETWTIDNPGATIERPNIWMSNDVPGIKALTGVKLSPGSYIALNPSLTAGGYCLYMFNYSSGISTGDASALLIYSSVEGGLQAAKHPHDWCP